MNDFNMPLFDIKATEELIIVAGGGGSKDFGVENGVTVLLKDDQDKKAFYETEDIITALEVYECDSEEENSIEENSVEEAVEISEEEEVFDEPEDTVISKLPEDECKTEPSKKASKRNVDAELLKDIKRRNVGDKGGEAPLKSKTSKVSEDFPETKRVIVAAVGESFLHVLRFDGRFHVLSKIKKGVKKVILSKNMMVLADNKIYGFYDVENHPRLAIPGERAKARIPEADISRARENAEPSTGKEDANIFRLVKEHNKIVCRGDSGMGKSDASADWDNFFINGTEIHKVAYSDNQSTFTYDDCDAEVSGKISKIICKNKILVFYSNHNKNSQLNINGRDVVMEKITSLAVHENIVAVSTVSGSIVFFENGKKSSEMKVSDLPITGIALDKKKIHFTVLNGVMGTVNTKKMSGFNIFIVFVLVFMLIGVAADLLYNKERKETL